MKDFLIAFTITAIGVFMWFMIIAFSWQPKSHDLYIDSYEDHIVYDWSNLTMQQRFGVGKAILLGQSFGFNGRVFNKGYLDK